MWFRDAIQKIVLSKILVVACLVGGVSGQNKRVVVQDGIGFSIYDYTPDNLQKVIPVLYFHGTSSTKSEPDLVVDLIRKKQRLVIAFDRPGYGHSAAFYFESLDDYDRWANEKLFPAIHQVLGFRPEKYDLVSVSGGAQYSLRMAMAMPEKVRKLSIFSAGLFARPIGEEGRFEQARKIAANHPRLSEWIVKGGRVNLDLTHSFSTKKLSDPDKRFADCHRELSKKLFEEATRCGASGIRQDARLQLCDTSYAKPISNKIESEIWNGACDYTISLASAKLLSSRTGIKLNIVQNEGHLSSLPLSFEQSVLPVARLRSAADGVGAPEK